MTLLGLLSFDLLGLAGALLLLHQMQGLHSAVGALCTLPLQMTSSCSICPHWHHTLHAGSMLSARHAAERLINCWHGGCQTVDQLRESMQASLRGVTPVHLHSHGAQLAATRCQPGQQSYTTACLPSCQLRNVPDSLMQAPDPGQTLSFAAHQLCRALTYPWHPADASRGVFVPRGHHWAACRLRTLSGPLIHVQALVK